jgi:hypothetical protein
MRLCDKIVKFGGRVLLVLYISGKKIVKQIEIGKKIFLILENFLNLLNSIKIL